MHTNIFYCIQVTILCLASPVARETITVTLGHSVTDQQTVSNDDDGQPGRDEDNDEGGKRAVEG